MITSNDVKLLKSERLTDEDDGGGRATGTAVVDNEMNNLFPDISRLDRTTGRISLRKVFAGVVTQTNDPYLGAHAIITETAKDPRVSVLLFNTGSQTDYRENARNLVESYRAPATQAPFELLGNQLKGQRSIMCIQREEQTLPEVGEVFQLVHETKGKQFFRATSVEGTMETFAVTSSSGSVIEFLRRRVIIRMSSPLTFDFPGGSAIPAGTSEISPTTGEKKAIVLSTQEADAARYFGIADVVAPIAVGDLAVKVESIYSQLVPSTTRENPLLALLAGYERSMIVRAGVSRSLSSSFQFKNNVAVLYAGTGVAAGSLTFTMGSGAYKDDSKGGIIPVSGSNQISSGSIDYSTGAISLNSALTGNQPTTLTFTTGARFLGDSITGDIVVDLGSRGYVYTLDLSVALPRPATLQVSYLVLGKWYTLKDNGAGELEGEGTGTIEFGTGAVSITLSALPDVDSSIMFSYISAADNSLRVNTGYVPQEKVSIHHLLSSEGIKRSSLGVSWKQGGATKTATDNGSGLITGDCTGFVNYVTGDVELRMSVTPDSGTLVTYTFERGEVNQEVKTSVSKDSAGMATFTIQGAPLKEGSVELQFMTTRKAEIPTGKETMQVFDTTKTELITLRDDGAGGWQDGRIGTIDYVTGQCWVQVEAQYDYTTYSYRKVLGASDRYFDARPI